MKVNLTPEKIFTVAAGSAVLREMRQVSAWENFIKLQNADGVLILFDGRSAMARTIDYAFDFQNKPEEWTVICASPGLLEKLQPTQTEASA